MRSATTGAVAAKAGSGAAGRARSATVVGKGQPRTSPVGASAKGATARGEDESEDALAAMLEKKFAGGGGEDFVFDV